MSNLVQYKVADLDVKRLGRIRDVEDVSFLSYSGSEIGFYYSGERLDADIISNDLCNTVDLKGSVCVWIDGDESEYKRIMLDKEEQRVVLFDKAEYAESKGVKVSELPETLGIHIIKYNEAAFGTVGLKRIYAEEGKVDGPLLTKKRKIEYIGDSITCGYGVEGILDKNVFNTDIENPHLSFSIKSAKKLDADYQLVSWSGIGIISDYIGPEVDEARQEILINQLYPYTDKMQDDKLGLSPEEWDFTLFEPDVIVLNIGTNDASYTREKPDREKWYADEMKQFIRFIHEKNKKAKIAFCYGIMDQTLCMTIDKLVNEINEEGEEYIKFFRLPLQDEKTDGYAVDYHPTKSTHEKMSVRVADYIREYMGW